ncbi:MAG: phosphopantothenoylcysteine decarboxylase domain-containing protein, partial [Solirubrobacteraceae bacterium]
GVGRLAEPLSLLEACEQAIAARAAPQDARGSESRREGASLRGLRVLVTAGGTREPIDSVRYIGNRSSGRMGMALAAAAARRGAAVTVVAANVTLPAPAGVKVLPVVTAAELAAVCEREFPSCDVLLMAAAVADFAPALPEREKIKKHSREELELRLLPTPDVIAGLAAARRTGQTLVGFAAEHGAAAVENARGKLRAKGLDAVVVNDISRADIGFEAAENEVTILTAKTGAGAVAEQHVPRADKGVVADAILDAVERLRAAG